MPDCKYRPSFVSLGFVFGDISVTISPITISSLGARVPGSPSPKRETIPLARFLFGSVPGFVVGSYPAY
jgi:hypothetical protein